MPSRFLLAFSSLAHTYSHLLMLLYPTVVLGSHHAWAWTQPDGTTVLGDFDDAVFEHKGVTTRFIRRGDAFFVETEGADGAMRAFEVTGVAGVAPLQQYLVSTEPDRLQALDIAWGI